MFINYLLRVYGAFECGFSSFRGQNRTEFSISFFIFGLVFLLLDLRSYWFILTLLVLTITLLTVRDLLLSFFFYLQPGLFSNLVKVLLKSILNKRVILSLLT